MSADLIIRIKKHPDGAASLSCTRADGSVTWQKQQGKLGAVFPPHDLTHYAVETVLGIRRAFYGLIAEGWEIEDFTTPWPRGPLPPEAGEVEVIVGALDMERMQGARMTAEAFAAQRAVQAEARRGVGRPVAEMTRTLTDVDLEAIRACRDALLERWRALPAGEALELRFMP